MASAITLQAFSSVTFSNSAREAEQAGRSRGDGFKTSTSTARDQNALLI